jgi:hypothetical protein
MEVYARGSWVRTKWRLGNARFAAWHSKNLNTNSNLCGRERSPRNFSHQDAPLQYLPATVTFSIYLFGYPNSLLPQFNISEELDVFIVHDLAKRWHGPRQKCCRLQIRTRVLGWSRRYMREAHGYAPDTKWRFGNAKIPGVARVGPRTGLDVVERSILPCRESNPVRPSCSPSQHWRQSVAGKASSRSTELMQFSLLIQSVPTSHQRGRPTSMR